MTIRRSLPATLVILWTVLWNQSLVAQPIIFDHLNNPDGYISRVFYLADGEAFEVTVTNTDTALFDYEVTGIKLIDDPEELTGAEDPTVWTTTQEHSAEYGGYYVRVKFQAGANRSTTTLKPKTWIIATQEQRLRTDVQVGLMGTPLVGPEYFLDTGTDGVKRVMRDREAEDDVSIGFASFATVYHDRRPWLGGSLGLGVTDNDLSVMMGPTIRVGNRAAITVGYHLGRIDRLPSGLAENDTFDGDNLTFEKVTRGDWFFSVSIRGFTDVFQKKLAKDSQAKEASK